MKNTSKQAGPLSSRARELRAQLARKIAFFIGSEENRATDVPGLPLAPADRPDRAHAR